jgi:hypothetical protein
MACYPRLAAIDLLALYWYYLAVSPQEDNTMRNEQNVEREGGFQPKQ